LSPSEKDLSSLDEAAVWVVRAQAGELGAQEQDALRAWLRQSPEHAAAMDLATRAWTGLGHEAVAPKAAPVRAAPQRAGWSGWSLAGAAAAAVAACVVAAVWAVQPSTTAYHVGPGRRAVVQLSDGSRIELASDTDVKVRTSLFSRGATLQRGQADFDIVHDARRPFTVQTRQVVLRDLGTRFAVRDRGDAEHVRLVQGRVLLLDPTTGRALRQLLPGQEAEVGGGPAALHVAVGMPTLAPAGGRDRMLLRDTSLASAVETLEWRTGADIVLNDPALGSVRVSGVYETDDAPSFLNALAQIAPVRWRVAGPGKFEVSRRD
jgi:transmembrane sensor